LLVENSRRRDRCSTFVDSIISASTIDVKTNLYSRVEYLRFSIRACLRRLYFED
jgi:hypothetical protein